MDRSQSIQQQFGASADRYRVSSYHGSAPDLQVLSEAAALTGEEVVLDIGTGTGHTALQVAPHARRVVGLDLTPAMLGQAEALAQERGIDNVQFDEGDAQSMRYDDDSFDCVTCRVCAHHFADPMAVLRETARVLRPGGQVLWMDTVAPEDPAQDTFLNALELLRDPSHVRDHSSSQWLAMFAEVGLTARVVDHWAAEMPFDDWTERMQTPDVERQALRSLLTGATGAIREAFDIQTTPLSWKIPIQLLHAR